jgi:gliding motility-associated-like protein
VYNAISADGDERNAIMRISNITSFTNNKVSVFNRWGDKVFEVKGYDNDQKAFRGDSNMGGTKELPAGTYFYVIDLGDGSPLVNGYISLKR